MGYVDKERGLVGVLLGKLAGGGGRQFSMDFRTLAWPSIEKEASA